MGGPDRSRPDLTGAETKNAPLMEETRQTVSASIADQQTEEPADQQNQQTGCAYTI